MMTRQPLMPKATAVWLVDNTALTFEQIAEFCGLHVLEVRGIADGDVAQGIKGMDPISSGQLTRQEIQRGQDDSSYRLNISEAKVEIPLVKSKKGPRYTPVSRRQDRPNAILWLLRNHAEMKNSQIMRLVGTTKPTIEAIRERTHWNSANLQPQDPVALGLCSQIDLDAEVKKAARRLEREQKQAAKELAKAGGTLLPAEETTAHDEPVARKAPSPYAEIVRRPAPVEEPVKKEPTFAQRTTAKEDDPEPDVDKVFAKLTERSKETPSKDEGESEGRNNQG